MIISHLVIVKMGEFSDKTCREIPNTYFMLSEFVNENHAVYEVTWKNIVEPSRQEMTTTWHMRIACRIPNATNARSECVILITFPPQQWLHKPAAMLGCICTFPVLYKISTL
jgi:hypothetical protein